MKKSLLLNRITGFGHKYLINIIYASTNYSWFHNIISGRSSDLAIHTFLHLPGDAPVIYTVLSMGNQSVQNPLTFADAIRPSHSDYNRGRKAPALQRRVRTGFAPVSLFTGERTLRHL